MKRGTQLLQVGWTRHFSAVGARLAMAVEAFEEMGREVILLDEVDDVPQLDNVVSENCEICTDEQEFKVIYTRSVISYQLSVKP